LTDKAVSYASENQKSFLCEDDTNLGMVLKNYLELNDYDVTFERDGRLGLAAFQREKFDICLLDVMMPNMDGFTVAEEIRDVDPDMPLFFISCKNNEGRYYTGL
jgi:two-component system OmpR family response regulator